MDETAALTPSAHRFVRWLDAQESAFPGGLVVDGEGMRVRVSAQSVPEPLWQFADAEHVAGVRDLVRTRSGHDVLLPWCPEPIEVFLGRRAAAEQPLATGETVTLVGSLLRGVTEVDDAALRGRWWLTDDARPIFAPGEGSQCGAATTAVISRLRDDCTDRMLDRVLAEIADRVEDPRAVRQSCERWEHELTELAAPRALVREVFPAERVSAIAAHSERVRTDAEVVNQQHSLMENWLGRARSIFETLIERAPWRRFERGARSTDARQPNSVSKPRAGRARMVLVGAAVAGAVLGVGLLWPSDSEDSAASERGGAREQTVVTSTSVPTPAGDGEGAAEEPSSQPRQSDSGDSEPTTDGISNGSLEQLVPGLLEKISGCVDADDHSCPQAIADGAGEIVQQRLAPIDSSRAVTPIEDYGDIAVLRLGSTEKKGEQMLVLVKQKDGWLVRDVYDVADQPSGEN